MQKNRPFAIKKEPYFWRVGDLVVEKESGKSRLDKYKLRLKQAARESWIDVSPQFHNLTFIWFLVRGFCTCVVIPLQRNQLTNSKIKKKETI